MTSGQWTGRDSSIQIITQTEVEIYLDLGAPYIFKYFNTVAFGTAGAVANSQNDLNAMNISLC